ncbi:MAG: FkbM family methyltransferase [Bryobacterales bacterium]|nr:FkbM family methyltransferase [Bryobacterales bacterium]
MRRAILAALLTAGLLAGAGVIYSNRSRSPLYAKLAMSVRYAVGQARGCSASSAWKLPETANHQLTLTGRIRAQSQLVRTLDGMELWRTPHGEFWVPAGTHPVTLPYLLAMIDRGVYAGVRPGDVVLDAGAHVGVFTRSALASGARLVVAIEPAPGNVRCLRRTFASEIDAGRVIVYPKGLWNRTGTAKLQVDEYDPALNSMVLPLQGRIHSIQVDVVTLDQLVRELGLETVSFLKLNIEGAEQQALLGGRTTLANHRPRIAAVPYHLERDLDEIQRLIRSGSPRYDMRAGECVRQHGHIRPEVLWFF